jgi:hypothetical protein
MIWVATFVVPSSSQEQFKSSSIKFMCHGGSALSRIHHWLGSCPVPARNRQVRLIPGHLSKIPFCEVLTLGCDTRTCRFRAGTGQLPNWAALLFPDSRHRDFCCSFINRQVRLIPGHLSKIPFCEVLTLGCDTPQACMYLSI